MSPSPKDTAEEIVVVEPACETLSKSEREQHPWCIRIYRFEIGRHITRSRAERMATRMRGLLRKTLRAEKAKAFEEAARIAEATACRTLAIRIRGLAKDPPHRNPERGGPGSHCGETA